jgi:4-amino-4-deoxy-L-arabinose transferase-like glycosyltransferase
MSRLLTLSTLALAVAALGLAILDVHRGPWDHDGGFYLLRASYIARGMRPYIDYISIYPPLMEMLDALPMALGGDRLVLATALPATWILANALATALLAWLLTRSRSLTLAAIALFSLFCIENGGNHITLEHGVALFSTLAFVALLARPVPERAALFLAGAGLSMAGLSKQNGALVLLPLLAILWTSRRTLTSRHAAAFLTGAIVPPLLIVAWLRFDVRAIRANFIDQFLAYGNMPVADPAVVGNELTRSPFTVLLLLLLAATSLAAIVLCRSRRLLILACAACIVLNLSARFYRNYPHYDLNVWPFAVVIACLLFHELRRRDPNRAAALGIVATAALTITFFAQPSLPLRWSRPGMLETTFIPAARELRRLDPGARMRVRDYGVEPVVEYLSGHLPELISIPYSRIPLENDGRGVFDLDPPRDELVVIVDQGQEWAQAMRRVLHEKGWVTTSRNGRPPMIVETLTHDK